jgi:hypothetical protein
MGLLQTKTEIIGGTGTPCSLMATLMLWPAIECSEAMINCYVHTEENDTHLIGSNGEFIRPVLSHHSNGNFYFSQHEQNGNSAQRALQKGNLLAKDNILVNHFPMKSRKVCWDCRSGCQFYVKASHGCIQKEIQQRIGTVPIGNSVHLYQREALQD